MQSSNTDLLNSMSSCFVLKKTALFERLALSYKDIEETKVPLNIKIRTPFNYADGTSINVSIEKFCDSYIVHDGGVWLEKIKKESEYLKTINYIHRLIFGYLKYKVVLDKIPTKENKNKFIHTICGEDDIHNAIASVIQASITICNA